MPSTTPESQASYPLSMGCKAQASVSLGSTSPQLSSSCPFASPVLRLSSFCTTIAIFLVVELFFQEEKEKIVIESREGFTLVVTIAVSTMMTVLSGISIPSTPTLALEGPETESAIF